MKSHWMRNPKTQNLAFETRTWGIRIWEFFYFYYDFCEFYTSFFNCIWFIKISTKKFWKLKGVERKIRPGPHQMQYLSVIKKSRQVVLRFRSSSNHFKKVWRQFKIKHESFLDPLDPNETGKIKEFSRKQM